MLKGIYKAASGMIPQLKKQEISANNIANAGTPGFKKDTVFQKELNQFQQANLPRKSDWETPMIDQVYTDYSQGTFTSTGNSLDVAIGGDGFFVLESPEGNASIFTRNGNFTVDTEGFLVNSEGFRVLSDSGPIEIGAGKIEISESGDVLINDAQTGRLRIVDFVDKSVLTKLDSSGFAAPEEAEPVPAQGYTIRQGYLEQSNINVIKEMVGMILTMRAFESGSKSLQIQDESLGKLINEVGKTQF